MAKTKPGPAPDKKKDRKVFKYLVQRVRITFRDMAKINDEDVKNTYERYARVKK